MRRAFECCGHFKFGQTSTFGRFLSSLLTKLVALFDTKLKMDFEEEETLFETFLSLCFNIKISFGLKMDLEKKRNLAVL